MKNLFRRKLIYSLEDNLCLSYPFKNPCGETRNMTYAYTNIVSLKTLYEKPCEEKLMKRKECNMIV
jgi:hypothetical protein